ncbi:MAG TPA: Asp-tRNA(Asn)/Glu-tRNA(Gln) amidotransferase subunit GatB, partial [Candidatus Saccharimonadales bacterium]|nr:Asp-tRNA(Asn)/Glu-tRNA(Gln) amidotransferase subunit GatB [Candidatus Saccharimonadales bacterium]
EIVSEPDISSAEEAKAYAKKIHQICRYIGVADVDMEKAGMRFDANVSLKKREAKDLGTKVEIKNINSFTFLEKAVTYEISRQAEMLEEGKEIIQETRGWVEAKGETVSQRTKETSPDYRYFPDPDLPPLKLEQEKIDQLKKDLPELPDEKSERFQKDYSLSEYDATVLTETKELSEWYEKALKDYESLGKPKNDQIDSPKAKKVANWITGELLRYLKSKGVEISDLKAEPAYLAELIWLVDKGEISNQAAKTVFDKMLSEGEMPKKIIDSLGLAQISDESGLEVFMDEAIEENQKAVLDFKSGKESSLQFLVGAVMRKSKGSANPVVIADLLRKKLQ